MMLKAIQEEIRCQNKTNYIQALEKATGKFPPSETLQTSQGSKPVHGFPPSPPPSMVHSRGHRNEVMIYYSNAQLNHQNPLYGATGAGGISQLTNVIYCKRSASS